LIRALLWDNDGVLVSTEPLYCRATRQVLASAGVSLTDEQYFNLFLVEGRGAWHLAADAGCSAGDIAELRSRRDALYGQLLVEEPLLIDGVTNVLDALHGRYVMGIVTTSRRDHFSAIHQTTGLLEYFDFVLTADDCLKTKPDPEPYVKAVEKTGLGRDACLAIEDSERGLASAKAAGIRCVVVPTAMTRRGRFAAADGVLTSITELPGWLRAVPSP
jgi:HAD superfamily hydrolase (TIGR01509 family)